MIDHVFTAQLRFVAQLARAFGSDPERLLVRIPDRCTTKGRVVLAQWPFCCASSFTYFCPDLFSQPIFNSFKLALKPPSGAFFSSSMHSCCIQHNKRYFSVAFLVFAELCY